MSETKAFHLGDILSITTGRLLSAQGIDGVYKILNFLTGEPIYTHQIGRAIDAAKPYLLENYPEVREPTERCLKAAELPDFSDSWEAWLIAEAARFCTGARLAPFVELAPMPANLWISIDPYKELAAQVGEERIILASLED